MAALPDVSAARVNLTRKHLTVDFSRGAADAARVIAALDQLGNPASPYDPAQAKRQHDREGRELVLALAVAGFGVMNTMMLSVPIWGGLFGQELGPAARTLMMWFSGMVGAPCALFAGMPFFRSAWRSLKARRVNMNVPISIGLILTLAISFSETVLRGRDVYFDSAVSLLFLLLIGRWLGHRLRARASSAAADLLALQAPSATLVDGDGRLRSVPLAEVAPGDRVLVRPGDRISVDGRVVGGAGQLDNSLLTGETTPAVVGVGALCRAGAVNLSGALTLVAVARSDDSAVAAIARLVETGLGPREALIRAVAVLIVTCPCALGLAAPVVQISASSRLFRRGMLVKLGAALERLAEVNHVILDKTDVLTLGRPQLIDAPKRTIAEAAPLARASRHPLARALAGAAGEGPLASEVIEHPGQGVEGLIDGSPARLGRAAFLGVAEEGDETELWFGFDGATKVRLRFEDGLRCDAAAAVDALAARGLSVEILSGDVAHAAMAPGSALEASQNAAGLVFSGEALMTVVKAVDIARSARDRALENFGFAALYNAVAAPAAVFGLVNPFVAAIAMSGFSLW